MKSFKLSFLLSSVIFLSLFVVVAVSAEGQGDATDSGVASSRQAAKNAITSTPVPMLSYFQERKTVARWAERWDKPSVATYIYLVSYGKVLGYYVADGKPASTRSYITPETRIGGGSSAGYYEETLPDLDGTYGDNNPGIRFFTAEGVAVEWAGNVSYLYSDAIIDFGYEVPRLNPKKK